MATLADIQSGLLDLQAKNAALITAFGDARAQITALTSEIAILQGQVAAGGGAATASDLDGVLAQITSISAADAAATATV